MRGSDNDRWVTLSLPLESALVQAGLDDRECEEALCPLKTALRSGDQGVAVLATSVKRWQKVVRNILAREPPSRDDEDSILSSRVARRSLHRMKKLGLTEAEIDNIISTQGRRRIPPFFWSKSLVRCLMSDPPFDTLKLLTAVACIGRTAPQGDVQQIKKSLDGFITNVEREEAETFDFSRITRTLLGGRTCPVPVATFWDAPGRGSRSYPRSAGGKRGEARNEIYMEFMHLPISTILPDKPTGDVYDILGNIACHAVNWSEHHPIGHVLYADRKSLRLNVIDDRFGMIGLIWALLELRKVTTIEWEVDEDWPFFAAGRTPVISRVSGSIESRVTAQPEEGWKVRIVTLTDFAVSLVGSTARHVCDPILLSIDPLIVIGLRSKVKLYDSLVHLNGFQHMGISSKENNLLHFSYGTSADLQTATDTPERSKIISIFAGWLDIIPNNHPFRSLIVLSIGLATMTREFQMPRGFRNPVHRCGIMMGEALSGILLNTASLIVRASVESLVISFPEIQHLRDDQINDFVSKRAADLQLFLDNFRPTTGWQSSQSGDDLFLMSFGLRSPYLRVLYRMLGFQPSNTTWFESTQYVTFCEEHCLRTIDSNGWTFVDTVKPRLFNIDNPDPEAVVSRIRQISSTLSYRKDRSLILKMIPLVNRMLVLCPEVLNTLSRYRIQAGLPSWLGGVDHPEGLLSEFELDEFNRKLLSYLYDAPFDVLVHEYLLKSYNGLSDLSPSLVNKTMAFTLLPEVTSLDDLNSWHYIDRSNLLLPAREQGEKYSIYNQRIDRWIKGAGLVSVKSIIDDEISASNTKAMFEGHDWSPNEVSVRIRLKKRRQHLRSLIPTTYKCVEGRTLTPWEVKLSIDRKLSNRFVSESFLHEHGHAHYPSFQVRGIWN